MAHPIGLRALRGTARALVAGAAGLSLLVFATVEGTHAHEGPDPASPCAVCELGHEGPPAPGPDAAVALASGPARAVAPPGRRPVFGIVPLSRHRSRAPPPPISR